MASPGPAKSHQLHNFELPELWNKGGQSSGLKKRRRSVKPPPQRPNASSTPPLRHPAVPESVAAPLPSLRSPLRDSAPLSSRGSPVQGDLLMKRSPVRGESSKPSPNREELKNSPVGGDSERLSLLGGDAPKPLQRRDLSSESEPLRKGKGGVIEYRRNHSSRSSALANSIIVFSSRNLEQAEKRVEKRSEETEDDEPGIKRPKISIKIPGKNNKEEEKSAKERPLKTGNKDEHGRVDGVREEGKIRRSFDDETKIWDLRPRKPKIKSKRTVVGGERGNVSGLPEKKKAQPPLKIANKPGGKEGKSGIESGEKKEKGEKQEKIEKEKGDKKEKIEKEKGEKKEKGDKKEKGEKQEKGEKPEKNEENGEKKEKKKLSISISLTREEIEEDIFAMTGSKPARRPKRRAKNVQKQVDLAFPGLWLVSITPESYKVSESSMKG